MDSSSRLATSFREEVAYMKEPGELLREVLALRQEKEREINIQRF